MRHEMDWTVAQGFATGDAGTDSQRRQMLDRPLARRVVDVRDGITGRLQRLRHAGHGTGGPPQAVQQDDAATPGRARRVRRQRSGWGSKRARGQQHRDQHAPQRQ